MAINGRIESADVAALPVVADNARSVEPVYRN